MLWDPYAPDDVPNMPRVSEGFMAEMLGMDRIELRAAYQDFLARHNAQNAREVRVREAAELVRQKRAAG